MIFKSIGQHSRMGGKGGIPGTASHCTIWQTLRGNLRSLATLPQDHSQDDNKPSSSSTTQPTSPSPLDFRRVETPRSVDEILANLNAVSQVKREEEVREAHRKEGERLESATAKVKGPKGKEEEEDDYIRNKVEDTVRFLTLFAGSYYLTMRLSDWWRGGDKSVMYDDEDDDPEIRYYKQIIEEKQRAARLAASKDVMTESSEVTSDSKADNASRAQPASKPQGPVGQRGTTVLAQSFAGFVGKSSAVVNGGMCTVAADTGEKQDEKESEAEREGRVTPGANVGKTGAEAYGAKERPYWTKMWVPQAPTRVTVVTVNTCQTNTVDALEGREKGEKTATANHPCGRVIVVGDVHGCDRELERLLDAVNFDTSNNDLLILAGDLIGKGPHSHGVRFIQLMPLHSMIDHDIHVTYVFTHHCLLVLWSFVHNS